MSYLYHIGIMVFIYSVLALSLDLLAGHTGLLSVAHAAFFGLGAYSSALITTHLGGSATIGAALVGVSISMLMSLCVSLSSLRLSETYFVISTFGFQLIVSSLLTNLVSVTRGPLGIYGIPSPQIFGVEINSAVGFLVLSGCLALFSLLATWRLSASPFGRILHAIREDEKFAQSLGKNTVRSKVEVVAVSAALASLAGTLYAHYITFVAPSDFDISESVVFISMVVLGGAASRWGAPIGAAALVIVPEVLRFVGVSSAGVANLRQVIYGLILVIVVLIRPRGIAGQYNFGG
jgi:branched-chain amino acid transport system permease protein